MYIPVHTCKPFTNHKLYQHMSPNNLTILMCMFTYSVSWCLNQMWMLIQRLSMKPAHNNTPSTCKR